jgi:hypothetical protein
MRYFVTSSKDASIYSDFQNQNTGIDAILDLFKYKTSEIDKHSRILIEFDYTQVSQSLSNGTITNPTFSLDLTTTRFKELASEFVLVTHPVSQSWNMGLGKRQDNPKTTTGVSYTYRDYLSGSAWTTNGGDFNDSYSSTQTFGTTTDNISFDVTDIVDAHISGTIPNYGFIVKFSGSYETDTDNYGEINSFSSETNTIYRPKLTVQWDDSSIVTGSLSEVSDEDSFVTVKNLQKEYKVDKKYKFRLHVREQFPTLTYSTGSVYSTVGFLPTGSSYSIVDNVTGDIIVPFDENSTLSVDSNGNYFNQDFKGWEAERFYRILFQINDGTDLFQIIDDGFVFKLVE